jgi:hypothetical protein
VAQYFEPATLHLEFKRPPDELMALATPPLPPGAPPLPPGAPPLPPGAPPRGTAKHCTAQVARLQQSTSQVLRDLSAALSNRGVLEPSFGCRILGAATTASGREKFWTLRLARGLPPAGLVQARDRLATVQGLEQVALVPRAIPPKTELDPYVGDSGIYAEPATAPIGTQWYLHACNVPPAWDLAWPPADSSYAPAVAVIDFGFWTSHPELKDLPNDDETWNTCDDSKNVSWGSDTAHGTGTLGLLAAARNGEGMMGVAFGIEVWPLQATCETPKSGDPAASGDPWAKAVDLVVHDLTPGRRAVILLEVQSGDLGTYESNIVVNEAIQRAVDKGIVVVMAAGNGGKDVSVDVLKNPITESGAILVGATTYDFADPSIHRRWADSNYGGRVMVSAPGDANVDLTLSADPLKPYVRGFGGTSGAAPKVAGVVAMMLNINNGLTVDQVKEILRLMPAEVLSDPDKPAGRFLDASDAVKRAQALAQAAEQVTP